MEELNFIEIGARIRAGREELGLTREQLAEQLEISAKFCSDIELGLRGISVKTHKAKRVEPTRPKSFIFHILGRFSPCNTKKYWRVEETPDYVKTKAFRVLRSFKM